jgi:predicted dehydrogenase
MRWLSREASNRFENVEAGIVAIADQFHVPVAIRAVEAGKHVFVETPLGVD